MTTRTILLLELFLYFTTGIARSAHGGETHFEWIQKIDAKTYDSHYRGAAKSRSITDIEAALCHQGVRARKSGRLCNAYTTPLNVSSYAPLHSTCMNTTWEWVNNQNFDPLSQNQTYGSCVAISTDDEYRYIHSNSVPPYYFNPYCPFGINHGYCIEGEPCPFPDIVCGVSKSKGYTELGDVWVAAEAFFKIPLEGNPTLVDRPASMYAVVGDGEKSIGPAVGVHVNGINIQGPNDAGAVNVDEAGFQLTCGGHVTPPVNDDQPPLYHYHKAADCTPAFKAESIPVSHGGLPKMHANLTGYANDGFGIYAYSDVGGTAPVLDECGGHFGPIHDDDPSSVVYHYHATTYAPYHLACQGPALQQCESTQHGTSFCGPGCGGFDVCVQPGTSKRDLESYLAKFNSSWLGAHTVNLF